MRIKLKNLRMQNALTQQELSTVLGYSSVYISQVELGNINGSTRFWKLIQMTFKLNADQLLEVRTNIDPEKYVD